MGLSPIPSTDFRPNRRAFMATAAMRYGPLAVAASTPMSAFASGSHPPAQLHHAPRAKRVIFLFMHGGPSHVDTFDYKPELERRDGQKLPFDLPANISAAPTLMKGPWTFSQHGQSGLWASDLLPEMTKQIDSLCFIRSMHTRGQSHGQAVGMVHTGSDNLLRPSIGAWISYAFAAQDHAAAIGMPSHVAITPATAHGGPRNYGAAFLPAKHQATAIGLNGKFGDGKIDYLDSSPASQFDLVASMNRSHLNSLSHFGDHHDIRGSIEAVTLANAMRSQAPEVMNLEAESESTHRLYGIGTKATDSYGRGCLLARKLIEAGTRFVSVSSGQVWDQHGKLKEGHTKNALATDRPVAGLIADLKQRGLWEDTLIVWGGEFGRTPVVQGKNGRDHNPQGFTMVLGGGGIRGGMAHGETDEFGYHAIADRVHMHDLHATILHLLGIDHTRLTFPYAGRDFRLTDVHGRVVQQVIA
ncbi:MAG: DUF1501 domain-containing protein [Planctomycetota bacterium]